MNRSPGLTRRSLVTQGIGAAGLLIADASKAGTTPLAFPDNAPRKGRIHQSVSRWCYGKIPLEKLCEEAKRLGLAGIDLLNEGEWEVVKQQGLLCTMAYGIGSIPEGWNHLENHDRLVAEAEKMIPKVSKAGLPNIITFSGNRKGLSPEQGIENCVTGLKRIARLAEESRVTVCMELLNSKRDHRDYHCDRTAWGVAVCKGVGSERIKLLFDIYHMQIMEGDICATIRENIPFIAHFHTGGVPGRHEIDSTQELNYTWVCQAIVESGFKGYLAHEFLPVHDPISSLRQAVEICDV